MAWEPHGSGEPNSSGDPQRGGAAGPNGRELDLAEAYRRLPPDKQLLLTRELAARRHRADGRIPVLPREGAPLPCSYAQERLWYLDQLDSGSVAYVMPAAVRLSGPLDAALLGRCLSEIVRRHEVLRTSFHAEDGRPSQLVREPEVVPLPVIDLCGLSTEDEDAAVREHYRAEVGKPFDLANDPLLRATLLRLSDTEHVLLLSMHHIVSDGWSLGVLQRELAALYQQNPLPDLEVQYADFAVWQRSRVEGGALAGQLDYWQERLADAPLLELPSDHSRATTRSSHGDAVPFCLDQPTVRRIDTLAEAEQATQFMVLLAGFSVLLWRWSGQTDLVIGSPIASRDRVETEPLVGFFANTLPLRLDLGADPTFRDLLRAARQECLAAYANQEIPFERLVQELRADRSAGPVPLVQVMLALRNVPMPELRLPGLTLRQLDLQTQSTKFDLCLDLVPTAPGGIDGRAEFSTDLFDADTIGRMMDSFQLLLAAALADPDLPVSLLPITTPAERARMIAQFSGGGGAVPATTAGTLHGLFEDRADHSPDAVAVAFGDQELSYRELDRRANRLAWFLRAEGVRPEQVVGISLPRSGEMVVALLGLLKAGAGYVPLDPNYPRRRVSYMADDAQVPLVLTHSSVSDPLRFQLPDAEGTTPRLVCLDLEAQRIAGYPDHRPPAVVGEPNLAYVVYTSGSTGRPKGSTNEHGRVANTLRGMNEVYGLTPADRMLAISSLNYDMSVYEIFGALAAGATVVVPSDIETTDPEQLRELLRSQRVTAWSSAPALLDMLVNHAYDRDGLDGVCLRVAGVGGDRMPPALPDRITELVPGVRLFNLAGMTEVSYCTTYHLVSAGARTRAGIRWGRPVPNHRIYVLDKHGEPVPVGVPGELFIGGAGPGRGYWRRPGLTARRFQPDPYSPEPGGRMYATGDHARFLPNGDLDFLGRLDHQVKIRGFRIELGEIEGALASHPAVGEPVVTAYEDRTGERRLAAYLTPRGDTRPGATDLRRFLSDRLPDHMVPSAYVVLDRLPLLPSGKLNRSALPNPAADRSAAADQYRPPADSLERVLAGLWADLLGVDLVGAEDDFFELGGHSLLATQCVSRIRDLFRVGLTIPGFLAAGTVRTLAGQLRQAGVREQVDVDATAELVLQVSALSAEEAEDRLRE